MKKAYIKPLLTAATIHTEYHLLNASVEATGTAGINVLDGEDDGEAGSRNYSDWDD